MDRPLHIATPPERVRRRQPEGWGSPVDPLHQSITEVGEHDFVAMLLRDLHYRNTYLSFHGVESNDAVIWKEVPLRKFRKHLPGDVDILVVPTERPERSTAIQVKRFKIRIESDDADNKLAIKGMSDLFEKGVQQANQDAALGCSQVYLWITVLIDSRIRNAGRYSYDGADSRLRSAIRNTISTAKLDSRVGLIVNEFVQGMDRPPFELSASGLSLDRVATATEQPQDMTQWLATLKERRYVAPSWARTASLVIT